MKLYILRHGQAETYASSDFDRRLTEKGRADVASMAARFKSDLQTLNEIWVSPLVRAQQTAQVALAELSLKPVDSPAFVTTESLVPEANLERLYRQLNDSQAKSLLLVSHQPLVGDLVNDLCGTEAGYHALGTASMACIEADLFAASLGELCWLYHPSH